MISLLLAAGLALGKPSIVAKPIPFGKERLAETAAYSRRHYGQSTSRLARPRVIVEHYTANESFSATWNTFASDAPDPELHAVPGTCARSQNAASDRPGSTGELDLDLRPPSGRRSDLEAAARALHAWLLSSSEALP